MNIGNVYRLIHYQIRLLSTPSMRAVSTQLNPILYGDFQKIELIKSRRHLLKLS